MLGHSAIALLEENVLKGVDEWTRIFDHSMGVGIGAFNALAELYSTLGEEAYHLGLWKWIANTQRLISRFPTSSLETGSAHRARMRKLSPKREPVSFHSPRLSIPYGETAGSSPQKRFLQSWDMLDDLGKQEALPELELRIRLEGLGLVVRTVGNQQSLEFMRIRILIWNTAQIL